MGHPPHDRGNITVTSKKPSTSSVLTFGLPLSVGADKQVNSLMDHAAAMASDQILRNPSKLTALAEAAEDKNQLSLTEIEEVLQPMETEH